VTLVGPACSWSMVSMALYILCQSNHLYSRIIQLISVIRLHNYTVGYSKIIQVFKMILLQKYYMYKMKSYYFEVILDVILAM